jgi:hypothetical protein
MEKIKSFDLEKPLFKLKGRDVPVEKFLPANITMLSVFFIAMSFTGEVCAFLGMVWYLSLPCSVAGGMCFCFFIQYFGENILDLLKGNRLPKKEKAAGLDGYCTDDIVIGGWGKAKVFYKEREYEVNAASSGETDILSGEKIVVLYESDGFYFVVRIDEVFKEIE